MKAVSLIVGLAIGLALSLSVALGVAWYFMRAQNAGLAAVESAATEPAPIVVGGGGGRAPAGVTSERASKFEVLDTDKDGKLTLSEFTADRQSAEAARWFERRDLDHDGFVSRTEYQPGLPLSAPR